MQEEDIQKNKRLPPTTAASPEFGLREKVQLRLANAGWSCVCYGDVLLRLGDAWSEVAHLRRDYSISGCGQLLRLHFHKRPDSL